MYFPQISRNVHGKLLVSFMTAVDDKQNKSKSKSAVSRYPTYKKNGIYGRGASPLNSNLHMYDMYDIPAVLLACQG